MLAWALTIFIQSSYPSIEIPKVEWISTDKIIHMGVFGLLTFLCYVSIIHLHKPNTFTERPLIWSAAFCIIYGASDEIHQYFVPNRSSEFQDWAADAAGVIIACLVINYFLKKRYVLFRGSIAK